MKFGRRASQPEGEVAPGHPDPVSPAVLPTVITPPPTGPGRPLVTVLERAQAARFTGSLRVTRGARSADVFLYEGGVYSATAPDLEPNVLARLQSSGITPAQLIASRDSQVGATESAKRDGFADSAAGHLAVVHQELLLAFLGVLITWPGAGALEIPGAVTDVRCTLPITWDILKPLLDNRALRHISDCARLGQHGTPARASAHAGTLLLSSTGQPTTTNGPEITALLRPLSLGASLDRAAGQCGFTRAEASHLAANLVDAGMLVSNGHAPDRELAVYDVPEAWATTDILVS